MIATAMELKGREREDEEEKREEKRMSEVGLKVTGHSNWRKVRRGGALAFLLFH